MLAPVDFTFIFKCARSKTMCPTYLKNNVVLWYFGTSTEGNSHWPDMLERVNTLQKQKFTSKVGHFKCGEEWKLLKKCWKVVEGSNYILDSHAAVISCK